MADGPKSPDTNLLGEVRYQPRNPNLPSGVDPKSVDALRTSSPSASKKSVWQRIQERVFPQRARFQGTRLNELSGQAVPVNPANKGTAKKVLLGTTLLAAGSVSIVGSEGIDKLSKDVPAFVQKVETDLKSRIPTINGKTLTTEPMDQITKDQKAEQKVRDMHQQIRDEQPAKPHNYFPPDPSIDSK